MSERGDAMADCRCGLAIEVGISGVLGLVPGMLVPTQVGLFAV